MTPQPCFKRKPGAQPGNSNALKHGFYAGALPALDQADLDEHPFQGTQEEAEILRLYIRRVVALTTQEKNIDLDRALHLLRILALSVTSLSHILRADQILFRNRITLRDLPIAQRTDHLRTEFQALEDARIAALIAREAPPTPAETEEEVEQEQEQEEEMEDLEFPKAPPSRVGIAQRSAAFAPEGGALPEGEGVGSRSEALLSPPEGEHSRAKGAQTCREGLGEGVGRGAERSTPSRSEFADLSPSEALLYLTDLIARIDARYPQAALEDPENSA